MIRAIKNTLGMAVIGAAVILASGLTANAQGGYYPQQDDGYYNQNQDNYDRQRRQERRAEQRRQQQEREARQRYERNRGYNNDGYNNDGYNNQNREALRRAINQGYQAGFREEEVHCRYAYPSRDPRRSCRQRRVPSDG